MATQNDELQPNDFTVLDQEKLQYVRFLVNASDADSAAAIFRLKLLIHHAPKTSAAKLKAQAATAARLRQAVHLLCQAIAELEARDGQ